jgi:hypothetical protein
MRDFGTAIPGPRVAPCRENTNRTQEGRTFSSFSRDEVAIRGIAECHFVVESPWPGESSFWARFSDAREESRGVESERHANETINQ